MTYNVFISYSTKDMKIVKIIRNTIKASNIEVFVADDSIEPGSNLNNSILNSIKKCDLFVLLWSKNSCNSDYVKQEVGIAKGSDKYIIPFVLNKRIELPTFINDLKYIKAYEGLEKSLEVLQKSIYKRVNYKKPSEKREKILDAVAILILVAVVIGLLSQE